MTNEDIEKQTEREFEAALNRLGEYSLYLRAPYPEALKTLQSFVRTLVAQAYEEAARRTCVFCHGEGSALHVEKVGGQWIHTRSWNANCDAAKIHDLKESLAFHVEVV